MSGRVTRSERVLDALAKRTGITKCGKDWLTAALDPFHDTIVPLEGFPDTNNSLSRVQCVPVTATITCPSGITTGTWDCNIVNLPWIQPSAFSIVPAGNVAGNIINLNNSVSVGAGNIGGVIAMASPTGNNLATQWSLSNYQSGSSTSNQITTLQPSSTYLKGKCRIIASGVEVHNTTSDLNKQGAVTVYRTPVTDFEVNSTLCVTNSAASIPLVGFGSYCNISSWPVNNNDMLLLAGSRSWKAEDGVYQVHALHSDNIPTDNNDFIQPCLVDSVPYTAVPSYSAYNIPSSGSTITLAQNKTYQWTKFDISGACFTGLSLQTTLFIRWNLYIERFPDSSLPDLVVLATPSPEYDPKALEAYSIALQDMPVGVPVAENGIGDWFSGVVNKISNVVGNIAPMAQKALSFIPHPKAQLVSKGLGLLAPPGGDKMENSQKYEKVAHQAPKAPTKNAKKK